MTLPVAVELGLVAVLFAVGFLAERALGTGRRLRGLPTALQLIVGGATVAPLLAPERWALGPVDGIVVALAASLVAWLALPVVLSWLVGTDAGGEAAC